MGSGCSVGSIRYFAEYENQSHGSSWLHVQPSDRSKASPTDALAITSI
jgi:hypothetical protein